MDPERLPLVEVPLSRAASGHLLVEVALGGRGPVSFLLDTAASASAVDPTTLPAAALARAEAAGDGETYGAGGALEEPRRIVREEIALGSWKAGEIELTLLELAHLSDGLGTAVAGVLGLDILARGDLWLDLARDRLTLTPPGSGAPARPAELAAHPFRRSEDGLIILDVELGEGVRVPAVLDLGASATLLDRAAGDLVGAAAEAAPGGERAAALGADRTPVPLVPHRLGGVRLGAWRSGPVSVHVADLPAFERLGFGNGPAALLGLDLFAGRLLGVSFEERRLYLSAARTKRVVQRTSRKGGAMLEREVVSTGRLMDILNLELAKREEAAGCAFFGAVEKLPEEYPDGGNWRRSLAVRGRPEDPQACGDAAADVIDEVAARFNLE